MKVTRKYVDYALAAVLLLVPVLVLRSSLKQPESRNRFDGAILRISSPLQSVANWVVGGLGGLWNDYVWLVDVEDENDELRGLTLKMQQELRRAQAAEARVASLEESLEFKQSVEAESLAAKVVASSVNSHFRVTRIRLDRGSDRVRVGMPVINAQGLIGRIIRTYGSYSDVLLLADPQSSIDVEIPRTKGRGLLSGLAKDTSYECQIEYLEEGKKVELGDEIVTSGLGKYFPEGLAVGKISAVLEQEKGLYQKVRVTPYVDFSSVETVLVLLAPPPPADPQKGKHPKEGLASEAVPF